MVREAKGFDVFFGDWVPFFKEIHVDGAVAIVVRFNYSVLLIKGFTKVEWVFRWGDVYCILILSGQNACSKARKLGTSGGGVVDHG